MRDHPAYLFAALAVLIALLALGLAIEANSSSGDPALVAREQIYSCMIDRYWEDGSSLGRDAEAAVVCMQETGVYDEFLADYQP